MIQVGEEVEYIKGGNIGQIKKEITTGFNSLKT